MTKKIAYKATQSVKIKRKIRIVLIWAVFLFFMFLFAHGAFASVQCVDCLDVGPTMTADNLPTPYVVSADSVHDNNYAYFAFDDNPDTYWHSTSGFPHWLKIDLGVANITAIQAFRIQARDHSYVMCPQDFKFQGSVNDSDWDDLIDLTNQATPYRAFWGKWFTFSNSVEYRYYRLYMIEGSESYAVIAGLEISEEYSAEPTEFVDFTPTMTADNLPSPYVSSADSVHDVMYSFQAFNHIHDTLVSGWHSAIGSPYWLKLDLGEGNDVSLNAFRFLGRKASPSHHCPQDFKFQGSVNDVFWYDLVAVAELPQLALDTWSDYYFSDSELEFRYYRFYIDDTESSYAYVDEWELKQVVVGLPTLPDTYIDIDRPLEADIIGTDKVDVSGDCQYNNVEISDGSTSYYTNCIFQIPQPIDVNYLNQQEVLIDGYTTSTGRTAGLAKIFKDDLGVVLPDFRDVRIFRYDGHAETFDEELNYWYDNNYFYFGVKEEAQTGWEYPRYRYYINWYWPYEINATTRLANPPPISYDFDGSLVSAYTITGSYSLLLSNLSAGEYTIKARSNTVSPYLLSDWTADRHFTIQYEQVPPYVLPDLKINYQDYSPFDEPTTFLQGILDALDGVLSPIAGFINNFNKFFNKDKATEYAITITNQFKVFISYTKLFDNIIGGYPITAGLILLIFVYIAVIVVSQIAKLISVIKP